MSTPAYETRQQSRKRPNVEEDVVYPNPDADADVDHVAIIDTFTPILGMQLYLVPLPGDTLENAMLRVLLKRAALKGKRIHRNVCFYPDGDMAEDLFAGAEEILTAFKMKDKAEASKVLLDYLDGDCLYKYKISDDDMPIENKKISYQIFIVQA